MTIDQPARLHNAIIEITSARRLELHGRSMLDQLQADVDHDEDSSPKTSSSGAASGYESRSPGRYAPRELLGSMAREVEIWVDWCGLDFRGDQYDVACRNREHQPWTDRQILRVFIDQHLDLRRRTYCTCGIRRTRTAMQANLGQLAGIAQQLHDDGWTAELDEMTHDLEKIGSGLRRYCGLERTFRPRVGCPNPDCPNAHRTDRDILTAFLDLHIDLRRRRPGSTITVWLDDQGRQAERARCHACSYSWDRSQVGLLLEHIRTTTSDHDDQGHELVDAWTAAHHLATSVGALRVWSTRNPALLPIVSRGPRGVAMYRVTDVHRLADARRPISA